MVLICPGPPHSLKDKPVGTQAVQISADLHISKICLSHGEQWNQMVSNVFGGTCRCVRTTQSPSNFDTVRSTMIWGTTSTYIIGSAHVPLGCYWSLSSFFADIARGLRGIGTKLSKSAPLTLRDGGFADDSHTLNDSVLLLLRDIDSHFPLSL